MPKRKRLFQGIDIARCSQVLSLGADILPEYKLQSPRIHKWTILHYSPFKAAWDWIILLLVMYTAIFTPYVAAFVLSDPDYNSRKNKKYGDDPIVIIDFIGKRVLLKDLLKKILTSHLLFFSFFITNVSNLLRLSIELLKQFCV